jgi:hypothetical protein
MYQMVDRIVVSARIGRVDGRVDDQKVVRFDPVDGRDRKGARCWLLQLGELWWLCYFSFDIPRRVELGRSPICQSNYNLLAKS